MEGSLIVSISIQTLPNGALSDLPAYRFRSQQASNFQLSNILVQGQSVSLFSATKDDGVTAFWVHNNYLATISLSSGMTEGNGLSNESEQSAIRTIINGWQWR